MAAAFGTAVPVAEAASSSEEPDAGQVDTADDEVQEDGGAVVYATEDMYIWEGTG